MTDHAAGTTAIRIDGVLVSLADAFDSPPSQVSKDRSNQRAGSL